ncbi:MAG TPA: ABC transporter permease [Anaerolinea thermolimosa]|uniref:Transport permease protein n=1 Tax=Anaerolinea thermolimosa TaxID=229919 RepID=A0A3D1JJL8_9CHLR|nr:ABC transporter permease [Anaerolinea thermolimosa]GAP05503.1 ABC-type multidrug transport system, permease component [Anaerolinea thermolimosa]HCE18425.1 ABC transporter permease [Anaerolinea thermolimosa]
MTALTLQLRASFAFVERNFNLIKRYWAWEMVWLIYSTAESLSVSFIGLGMGAISGNGAAAPQVNTGYLVLYLLIGTLVWRFLSMIFYWITDLINIERWEGTIEYTLMAPVRRLTHMAGQTVFAVVYSLFFTGIILTVTTLVFKIDLSRANIPGGVAMILSGSISFIGIGIMASSLPLLFPERGAQMTNVFIALLMLVSGVYYPVSVLPGFLRQLAVYSPATYVLEGVRLAMLENVPTHELWGFMRPVLLIGVFLVPAGLWVFAQAERYAKRTGKLHRNG